MSQLEGVYSLHEPHFWTLCSDVYVGAVKVEVAPNADAKYILSQTHNIFTAVSKNVHKDRDDKNSKHWYLTILKVLPVTSNTEAVFAIVEFLPQ